MKLYDTDTVTTSFILAAYPIVQPMPIGNYLGLKNRSVQITGTPVISGSAEISYLPCVAVFISRILVPGAGVEPAHP